MSYEELSGGAAPGTGTRIVAGAGLIVAALAASQLRAGLLVVVLAIAVGMASAELAWAYDAGGLKTSPVLWAAGAMLLPLVVFRFREPGLTAAAAALIFIAAGRWVLGRPARGAVQSIAAFVLCALYVGLCSAYLILLRIGGGARLFLGLAVTVALFHACRWVAEVSLPGRPLAPHLGPSPTLTGSIAGLAGAFVGIVVLLWLNGLPIRARLVVELGLAVGCALTLGSIAWALIRPDPPPKPGAPERSPVPAGVLSVLQGALLSAPALFYALRVALR